MSVYFTVSGLSPVDFMKASITFRPKEPLPLPISRFSSCCGLETLAPERNEKMAYGAFWSITATIFALAPRRRARQRGSATSDKANCAAFDSTPWIACAVSLARDDGHIEPGPFVVALLERDVPCGVAAERGAIER